MFVINDPDNLRRDLERTVWGTTQIGNLHFITCPLCLATMPASFTNSHELLSGHTPKKYHIDYHVAIALQLERMS